MPLKDRILFIKDFLADDENEEDQIINLNTPKARALKFLNALETVLYQKSVRALGSQREPKALTEEAHFFNQIFKAREFLRQPGSSQKSLLESIAISVPVYS